MASRVPQTEQIKFRPPASFLTCFCSQNPRSRRHFPPALDAASGLGRIPILLQAQASQAQIALIETDLQQES
jgi:tRNA1(Val) A37 N6-methylase TrmN6